LSVDAYLASEAFVSNFGIPALTVFSPNSKSDLVKLESLLAHAITLYEPRLTQVRVKASNEQNDHNAVKIEILSAVIYGNQMLRFAPSFHLHPGQLEVVVQPEMG
jgi:type VI secretion system protein ImpF